jgi:hypothetical protein
MATTAALGDQEEQVVGGIAAPTLASATARPAIRATKTVRVLSLGITNRSLPLAGARPMVAGEADADERGWLGVSHHGVPWVLLD